jgi:hypothetical protein
MKCWETFKWNLAYRSNYQHHHTNHEWWHKADETKVANLTQIAPGPVLEVDKLVDLDIQGVGRNTMQTTMQAPPDRLSSTSLKEISTRECICIFYYRNSPWREDKHDYANYSSERYSFLSNYLCRLNLYGQLYNFAITEPWCSMLNQSNTTKFDRRVIIKYGSIFSYTLAAEILDNIKCEIN